VSFDWLRPISMIWVIWICTGLKLRRVDRLGAQGMDGRREGRVQAAPSPPP